jgi:hypothetical protein
MRKMCIVRGGYSLLMIAGLFLNLSAYNTTKATTDTMVNSFEHESGLMLRLMEWWSRS